MSAELVERWEAAAQAGLYRIDVMRIEPRLGREYFDVRMTRDGQVYETRIGRTPAEARERVQHAVNWAIAYGPTPYKRVLRDVKLAPPCNLADKAPTLPPNRFQLAAKLALFLIKKTGTRVGKWQGTLLAAEQRALFGRFIGKGSRMCIGVGYRFAGATSAVNRSTSCWRNGRYGTLQP
jgi:hypothetical protein